MQENCVALFDFEGASPEVLVLISIAGVALEFAARYA